MNVRCDYFGRHAFIFGGTTGINRDFRCELPR